MEYRRMESPTAAAPFSRKLVNVHSFAGKSLYDGVFAAPTTARSGVEDYDEIFGGPAAASSIPFLDVPDLNHRKLPVDARRSNLDYSEIFGGFRDFECAVSHHQLLSKPKKAPRKTRSRSEASCPSGSPATGTTNQVLSEEASARVIDGVKEYKMSYNKTRSTTNSEVSGVTHHVAELHAVPGYAHVIDENNGPAKAKAADKPLSSVLSDTSRTVNFDAGMMMMANGHRRKLSFDVSPADHGKQMSPRGVGELQNKDGKARGADLSDLLFEAHDVGSKSHQEKEVPHASTENNAPYTRGDSKASLDPQFRASSVHFSEREAGAYSPTCFDEDVETNSDAAASAAAVRKAIEEAKVRMKHAKERMERKKEGHQPHMKTIFSSVKKTRGDKRKVEVDVNKFQKVENSDETLPSHTFAWMEKPNVMEEGLLTPDSDERERVSSVNEAVDVMHNESLTTSQADIERDQVQELETGKGTDNQQKLAQTLTDHEEIETSKSQKESGNKLETVGDPETVSEKNLGFLKNDYGLKGSEERLKLVEDIEKQNEDQTNKKLSPSREQIELKTSRLVELYRDKIEEMGESTDDMNKLEMLEKVDEGDLEQLKNIQGQVDNQGSKESVFEHEGVIKSENASEMEEDESIVETLMLEEFQRMSKEACLMAEQVDTLKEACEPTVNEEKQDICYMDINDMVPVEPEKSESGFTGQVNFMNMEKFEQKLEDPENHDSGCNQEDGVDMFEEDFNRNGTDRPEQISGCAETKSLEEEIVVGAEIADEEHHVHENNPLNDEDELEKTIHEESFPQQRKTRDFTVQEVDNLITEETETHSVSASTEGESESVELLDGFNETLKHHASSLATLVSECERNMMQKEDAEDFLYSDKVETVHRAEIYLDRPNDDQQSQELDKLYRTEEKLEEVDCESQNSTLEAKDKENDMAEKRKSHDSESSAEGCWVDDSLNFEDNQTSAGMNSETNQIDHIVRQKQDNENLVDADHDSMSKVEKVVEESSLREVQLEKEQKRKIDEKERKREREKERKIVERAIREARDRAFAGARERALAGRAVTNKANEQDRHKVTSEATGKLEKPTGEACGKALIEAKLKSERAAVERATSEARVRALEKALSDKTSFKSRNQPEKLGADRVSSSFNDNVAKQRVNHRDSGSAGSSGNSSSANHLVIHPSERFDGTNGESAQRCKARTERHQRTAERAAKALEDMNMRDRRAQREQAERNRMAESLDAEIKRWSSGKEKNLRALLSTLQYILGPDSGWQPIPLTDIIATASVKKAYRKATLSVHPDKLQQRGASIQQKYICEKVFDLLKDAWNRFNAEER